jgi:hypothetical protein
MIRLLFKSHVAEHVEIVAYGKAGSLVSRLNIGYQLPSPSPLLLVDTSDLRESCMAAFFSTVLRTVDSWLIF